MTHTPVELRADVEFTRAGEEGILYDEAQGRVHVLNHTGALVWERLRDGAIPEDVAQQLADEHGIPLEHVQEHIAGLLHEFDSLGLVAGMSNRRASG